MQVLLKKRVENFLGLTSDDVISWNLSKMSFRRSINVNANIDLSVLPKDTFFKQESIVSI